MNFKKIVNQLKKSVKNLSSSGEDGVQKLYNEHEYLDAYMKHTDIRIEADSKSAIGGKWDEIGQLQFDFLVKAGLQETDKFLDIGCGTLRGGRHFIKLLSPNCYFGIDISSKAIEQANKLVEEEGLTAKNPHLSINLKKDLTFETLEEHRFDIILAQSVFTHLLQEHIEECFANVGKIMHPKSRFFFTYFRGTESIVKNHKDFWYPASFFEELADTYGFELKDKSAEYNHPRNQIMMELRLKP